MIAILPAGEAERAARAAEAGIPDSAGGVCLTASDGTECLGFVFYRLSGGKDGGKRAELFSLRASDPRLADGLLRAALNAALDAGAQTAVCGESGMFPFLQPLGFRPSGESGGTSKTREEPGKQESGDREVIALIREIFNKGCSGGCHGEHSGK